MNLNSILQTALMIKLIVICLAAQNQVGSLQDLTGLLAIGQPLEQEAEKPLLYLSQLKNKFFGKLHFISHFAYTEG